MAQPQPQLQCKYQYQSEQAYVILRQLIPSPVISSTTKDHQQQQHVANLDCFQGATFNGRVTIVDYPETKTMRVTHY
ncbi:hypothetical protein LguiA_001050 [Lonicera macranthoides]